MDQQDVRVLTSEEFKSFLKELEIQKRIEIIGEALKRLIWREKATPEEIQSVLNRMVVEDVHLQ